MPFEPRDRAGDGEKVRGIDGAGATPQLVESVKEQEVSFSVLYGVA